MIKAVATAILLFATLIFLACRPAVGDPQAIFASSFITSTSTTAVSVTTNLSTTATGAATDSAQPRPLRAAFYYPWYPDAWRQGQMIAYSHYTPTLGFYNSSNLQVIRQHIAAMQYGHIDAGIASWWGQRHHTDGRVPALLTAAEGTTFRWALYYEAEGQGDPTVEEITADLTYLHDRYARHANYLSLEGRMVLFVYANTANGEDDCRMVERWHAANSVNAYLVFKVFRGFRDCAVQPDGWHQYGPASAESWQRGYSFSISPGFWAANDDQPRLARNLTQWRQNIRNMIASGEPFQLITSFNEWGEGTAIEAATAWASDSPYGLYLDALHENGVMESVDTLNSAAAQPPRWPPPAPPPTPAALLTLTAVADGYVTQEKPTLDYGAALLLRSDLTPTIYSYLRFELPVFPGPVQQATLRLFVNNRVTLGYEVRTLTDTTWLEESLTFSTAPPPGYVINTAGPVEAQQWSTVDVTNGLPQVITQAGSVSFVLANLNDSAASYASRETATPPTLVIAVGAQAPTSTAAVTKTMIYAVGDIADCTATGDEATAALLDERPGLILTLGDTVYISGTTEQFDDCFAPVWGRHKARIRPVVGNHEYITPDAAPYFAYFGAAAGDPDKGYYSYEVGEWHVIALNSNCLEVGGCHASSPQEQWLRADLDAHPTHCTLAYMHHPRWSSGKYGENQRLQPLVEALYEYGVDLLLAGHAHHYERYAPQDPNSQLDLLRGIRQINVGTGGKNHQPIITVLPNSEVRDGDTFGVLQLTLHSDRYDWEFLPVPGGHFTDRGSTPCR